MPDPVAIPEQIAELRRQLVDARARQVRALNSANTVASKSIEEMRTNVACRDATEDQIRTIQKNTADSWTERGASARKLADAIEWALQQLDPEG